MSSKLIVDTIEDSTGTYSLALGSGNSTFPGGIHIGGTGSANLLDDYEEGTFTPSLLFGGGSTGNVLGAASGTYLKIGSHVTVWIYIYLTTKGSSTGHASVSGLPFTITNSNGVFSAMGDRGRVNTGGRGVSAYISGGSEFFLYSGGYDGTVNAQVNDTHFTNTSEVDIVATYLTS